MTDIRTETGTVTGVHGKHIFIADGKYPTIYAHRRVVRFSDPYIGLEVKFELDFKPEMRDPIAGNVRKAA